MDVDEVRAMIGRPLGPTDWWDVDQHLIDSFTALTGDTHWMHIDPVRAARESGYGGTIAPGLLTLLVVPRYAAELTGVARGSTMVLNYGLNRVRFPAPVLAGSRLRGTATVSRWDSMCAAPRSRRGAGPRTVATSGRSSRASTRRVARATW